MATKVKRGGKRLTEAQQNAIYKAKPQDSKGRLSGPSWASLAKKYGVSATTVQRAWGKANLRSPTGGPAKATKELERMIKKYPSLLKAIVSSKGKGGSGNGSDPTFPIFNMMKRPTAVKPKIKNGKAS
tara:strand:+ start:80 stop:463 length:384 start_codon:yes stop_codon:yes gene_type:complete